MVSYRNVLQDNARWQQLPLREGDIVISTPAKCGTTWTQMICALLVFQTPELPRPLDELSMWPDALTHKLDDILAAADGQPHRRFFKTHTPFDGLPFDERVTYICVGRDPRDCALSWDSHASNVDFEIVMAMRAAAVGLEDLDPDELGPGGVLPPPPESAVERFWQWVDQEDDVVVGLAANLHHVTTFWQRRQLPNVVLLHYDDLKADLAGQMRALAARLGIEVPQERWPALVRAATFEYMSGRAAELAPDRSIWLDPARFFHRGTSRQWASLLDAEGLRRYARRVAGLADSDLVEWVHRGPILG